VTVACAEGGLGRSRSSPSTGSGLDREPVERSRGATPRLPALRAAQQAGSGFTLFEILVVLAVIAAVTGFAMTVLVSAHHRFGRARAAAESRTEIARAARRMSADIRSSSDAAVSSGEDGDALALVLPDGTPVTWRVSSGRLVRTCAEGDYAYRARVGGLKPSVEKLPGRSIFVEVRIEAEAPRGGHGARRARDASFVYVGASPRVGGMKR
jgi:prepilin-type N-terminal cleavage/methylation domain-containing protein